MYIHNVEASKVTRWRLDPELGQVKATETVLRPATTHSISYEGELYEAEDGTFDVPDEVGAFFLRMPGWYEGENPFPPEQPEEKPKSKSAARRKPVAEDDSDE